MFHFSLVCWLKSQLDPMWGYGLRVPWRTWKLLRCALRCASSKGFNGDVVLQPWSRATSLFPPSLVHCIQPLASCTILQTSGLDPTVPDGLPTSTDAQTLQGLGASCFKADAI